MRLLRHLKSLLRATDVLESINAGIDHQQRLLDDKLERMIELQKLLLENQKAELDKYHQQIAALRELFEKAGSREQARLNALIENQNTQLAFQRVQIEMIGEWVKAATGGQAPQSAPDHQAAGSAAGPTGDQPAAPSDQRAPAARIRSA
jgi:hypothetical protein